jgi:hypothetical protein
VASFTSRQLCYRRKWPQYPTDRSFGGTQNRSGQHGEEKNFATTGIRTPTPRSSSL